MSELFPDEKDEEVTEYEYEDEAGDSDGPSIISKIKKLVPSVSKPDVSKPDVDKPDVKGSVGVPSIAGLDNVTVGVIAVEVLLVFYFVLTLLDLAPSF